MSLDTLTTFFAWMTAINFALLLFTSVMLILLKGFVIRSHQWFFDLSAEKLEGYYFSYLARFKIMVLVFNLAPYIALRIIA